MHSNFIFSSTNNILQKKPKQNQKSKKIQFKNSSIKKTIKNIHKSKKKKKKKKKWIVCSAKPPRRSRPTAFSCSRRSLGAPTARTRLFVSLSLSLFSLLFCVFFSRVCALTRAAARKCACGLPRSDLARSACARTTSTTRCSARTALSTLSAPRCRASGAQWCSTTSTSRTRAPSGARSTKTSEFEIDANCCDFGGRGIGWVWWRCFLLCCCWYWYYCYYYY